MMSAITKTQDRLLQVILAPQITEKATHIADKHQQIAFKVRTDATKPEIKAAVELVFKVEVQSVAVINVGGKTKRAGRSMGTVSYTHLDVYKRQHLYRCGNVPQTARPRPSRRQRRRTAARYQT